jgi:predicted GIY-YIG superfamily endonuclease
MASLGTITLTGESKTTYEFNIYDRSTKFNPSGAVYVMSRINENNRYQIIYVGQTGDLSDRPLNHHKTDCFDKHRADKLLIRSESSEDKRFKIETDLVRNYNPQCND